MSVDAIEDDEKLEMVRTPLEYFDITSGGLRFGTLAEFFGANQSGKTTACNHICGYFQEDYPDGVVHLIDSESSFDRVRAKHVFDWDLSRFEVAEEDQFGIIQKYKKVKIYPTQSLEEGFFRITKILSSLEAGEHAIILWDTISVSPTRDSYNNTKNAKKVDDLTMWSGGRTDRPRIIKHYLRSVMSDVYGKNCTILLPNQVFASMSMYEKGGHGEGSALKHDLHYSFEFKLTAQETDEETGLTTKAISNVSLEKNKFGPKYWKVPLVIDVEAGGRIDKGRSMAFCAKHLRLIKQKGAWNYIDVEGYSGKSFYWKTMMANSDDYFPIFRDAITKMVLLRYKIIRYTYDAIGKGDIVKRLLGSDESSGEKDPEVSTEDKEISVDDIKDPQEAAAGVDSLIDEASKVNNGEGEGEGEVKDEK